MNLPVGVERELRSKEHVDWLDHRLDTLAVTLGYEGDERQWTVRDSNGNRLFGSPYREIAEVVARSYRGDIR